MRDASLCADEDGGYYDNLLTSPASRFPGPVGGVSTPAGFAPRRAKSQRDAKASHPLKRKIVSFIFYSRVFCSTYFCTRFNLYLIEVDNRYHPRISHEAFYICKCDEACTRTTEVSHRNSNLMRPRTRCERRNMTSSNDRNNVSPSDSIRTVKSKVQRSFADFSKQRSLRIILKSVMNMHALLRISIVSSTIIT